MTFEEFFAKKRIDLEQLHSAEPLLYEEFKRHYALMGEKSFDHSKKFWFNRLRRSYHLAEEMLPTKVKDPGISNSPIDENKAIAEAEAPQATKPTGFKPRFKAPTKKTETSGGREKDSEQPTTGTPAETPASSTKPSGFKPRFKKAVPPEETEKPQSDRTTDVDTAVTQKSEDKQQAPAEKPLGFKPRFKAGITNKATPPAAPTHAERHDKEKESEEIAKPLGFKPRFKAGLTNQAKSSATSTPSPEKEPQEEAKPQKTEEHKTDKPLGFKPRFKASKPNPNPPSDSESD